MGIALADFRVPTLALMVCGVAWPVEAAPVTAPVAAPVGPGSATPVSATPEAPLVIAPLPAPILSDPETYRIIARREAARADVPFDLVDAVMQIESDYRPDSIGGVGEIGLMQVRPETAAMLGFDGEPKSLADPAVNIHYGTTYLGRAWHLAAGNVCRALMKYRAGNGEETMSPLSAAYCAHARDHLLEMSSPLAATIAETDLVAVPPLPPASPVRGASTKGRAAKDIVAKVAAVENAPLPRGPGFWPAFEARIKRANARIEAKWRQAGK